jgi:hypothetical protein
LDPAESPISQLLGLISYLFDPISYAPSGKEWRRNDGGGRLHGPCVGKRTDSELKKQCAACGLRFDCTKYSAYLNKPNHPDSQLDNVKKD